MAHDDRSFARKPAGQAPQPGYRGSSRRRIRRHHQRSHLFRLASRLDHKLRSTSTRMCAKTSLRFTASCVTRKRLLFEKLITVSGIGPKLAITILSGMAADEMVGAIRGNDVVRLTRIPGIGKKTAERMVLELRDKLPQPGRRRSRLRCPPLVQSKRTCSPRLINLGYQRAIAEKGLSIATKNGRTGSFDVLFREALAALSK